MKISNQFEIFTLNFRMNLKNSGESFIMEENYLLIKIWSIFAGFYFDL